MDDVIYRTKKCVLAQVTSFQISDRTANYQMSKSSAYPSKSGACPNIHVRLYEIFYKESTCH